MKMKEIKMKPLKEKEQNRKLSNVLKYLEKNFEGIPTIKVIGLLEYFKLRYLELIDLGDLNCLEKNFKEEIEEINKQGNRLGKIVGELGTPEQRKRYKEAKK